MNRIKMTRRMLHMTQAELAKKVGITQGAISMIENGDRAPSLEVLIKIASALNSNLDDLIKIGPEDTLSAYTS